MTGGGWGLLRTMPLLLSDWIGVSTLLLALVGHGAWRVESG